MGYLYCTRCGKFYKGQIDKEDRCEDIFCRGHLVEIDENIIMPIKILNEKGYKTAYCCAGHVESLYCGGYIAFNRMMGLQLKDITPPKGWKWDEEELPASGHITMRWSFKTKEPVTRQKMIFQRTLSLINWCEELPNIEED